MLGVLAGMDQSGRYGMCLAGIAGLYHGWYGSDGQFSGASGYYFTHFSVKVGLGS